MESTLMTQSTETKVLKLSDDAIYMVRELIQLSLLTGTNLVDHFRAMRFTEGDNGYVMVLPEYVVSYNEMVQKLNEDALKLQEAAQASIVKEA